MRTICSGCRRELTPSPDTDTIRLYWVCPDLCCPKYGHQQRVEWASTYLGTRTGVGAEYDGD